MNPASPALPPSVDRARAQAAAFARLEADGLVRRRETGGYATTRRWQGAMSRAALRLMRAGDPGEDLRVPVSSALLEHYGASLSDDELVECVLALAGIEARDLVRGAPVRETG